MTGRVAIAAADQSVELQGGDTTVLPANVERQVRALEDATLIVCGFADGIASVPGEDAPRGTPAWVA